ncbi:type II secretion system F family protein [Isoptericola variabilis]|uniref:Type II secretion system F domain protein n=1 Tax=Isoptericola variabilis (strain 225) TaxID=743718 RepID=F6FQU8_ISOV2|nr:type II secretion system F family protein [Isoptericola variabilis]AEG42913.1 Type II secretion system F domain protein [Isoptericola variabilis 225]TWH31838.1 tight adherence protein B [Isoptericola variabilis J7]
MSPGLWGPIAVAAGLALVAVLILAPDRAHLPRSRRRPSTAAEDTVLAGAAATATSLVARAMRRREGRLSVALDLAGVRMRPQDFVFLVLVAALVLAAMGLLVGGFWLMLLFAALTPLFASLWLRIRTSSRRKKFGDQLDDTLQLLAGNLRAGHSLMQALAGVAREADDPTASELGRIVNETRVGRPLGLALEEASVRMENQDFHWVSQAIAINRQVGGNLADVLEGVGKTIRERNEIRRHVRALSADGRLSGIILVSLPIVVAGFLGLTNPGYIGLLFRHPIGIVAVVIAVILLLIGSFWMSRVVRIKF